MSEFVVPVRPRYGEVDRMGVVYHAHYLVYFELGRTEFMRALGVSYASVEEDGFRLVVVEARVDYRQPARYDQQLSLGTRVVELRGASVTFGYELRDEHGEVLARGATRLGCLDQGHRPVRLPAELRRRLQEAGRPAPPATSERS